MCGGASRTDVTGPRGTAPSRFASGLARGGVAAPPGSTPRPPAPRAVSTSTVHPPWRAATPPASPPRTETARWRARLVARAWATSAFARDAIPDSDYPLAGAPLLRAPGADPPAGQFVRLKRFPAHALDRRRAHAFMARWRHPRLLQAFRALHSVGRFTAAFIDAGRARAIQPLALRRARLADHLMAELRQHGALVPFRHGKGPLPYTAAIRAVPDRKDASLARVVLPCLQLNAAARAPPLPPTPYIRVFVDAVLSRRYMATSDFVGWFWCLQVGDAVARRFFAVYSAAGFEALRRGLLGWRWTPYLMATLAQLLACVAAVDASPGRPVEWASPAWLGRPPPPPGCPPEAGSLFEDLPLTRGPGSVIVPICIDNVTIAGDSRAEVDRTVAALRSRAGALGIEVHDVQSSTQRAVSLGIEFSLGDDPKFRVARPWAAKWTMRAAEVDARATLPLLTLWRLVGGAVYAAYAEAYPFTWVGGALALVRRAARQWAAGEIRLMTEIPYEGPARDCVRAVATSLGRGSWRRMAAPVGRPIFSDAAAEAGRAGYGAVTPQRRGYVAFGSGWRPTTLHINVLEAGAAAWAAARARPQPGRAVPRVLDSAVAAYWMYRGAAPDRRADDAIRRAYETAARRGEGWGPILWVPSADMPADAPSRHQGPVRYRASETSGALTRSRSVGVQPAVIAALPPGWKRPVTEAEFWAAVDAASALVHRQP